jgi:formylglycine-generating enzyme required for sulfatase activity
MVGAVFSEEPKQLPKELTVDLGGGVKLELVLIPAGEFMIGSPDSDEDAFFGEKPQHRVRITKPFCLGKYLVTQEQWEALTGSNPSHFKGLKNPVDSVSWEECQLFLDRLNRRQGNPAGKFQLPTESQWEFACRAGSRARYYFGDDEDHLGEYAWYEKNSGRRTHPVGEKKPNTWGLYDMHGNVWEWCADRWDGGYYTNSLMDDPTGPSGGSSRVVRGGGWLDYAGHCRSASRGRYAPASQRYFLGFRVARVAK